MKLLKDGTIEGTPIEIKEFLDIKSKDNIKFSPNWTETFSKPCGVDHSKEMYLDPTTQPRSAGSVSL